MTGDRQDQGEAAAHDPREGAAHDRRIVEAPRRFHPRPDCPRCAGPLYADEDGDRCCLMCGLYVYASSPAPVVVNRQVLEEERLKRGRPRLAAPFEAGARSA